MDYLSHTDEDRRLMLERIGASSTAELFRDLPERLLDPAIELPPALSEPELLERAARITAPDYISFLGAGVYDSYLPSVVGRLIGRPEFQTAYTPYQPEISQGTLTTIYEFQTSICRLTGLDIANASIYDGASAAGEAAALAARNVRKANRVLVSRGLHPLYRRTIATYVGDLDCADGRCTLLEEVPLDGDGNTDLAALEELLDGEVAAVFLASPNFLGVVEDPTPVWELVHEKSKALAVQVATPLALALYKTPAACGADICVGDGQPVCSTPAGGGPFVGFFAATKKLARKMPGRIVGRTVDADGKTCYALTLQTREQHIRREKATSNICTNNALMALAADINLALLGPRGITELAELNLQKAHYAADKLTELPGVELRFPASPFFNEFVLRLPAGGAAAAWEKLPAAGFIPGLPLARFYDDYADCLLVAVTDRRSREQIDHLAAALEEVL
jgi:glycine dehydrogenase subunit 1